MSLIDELQSGLSVAEVAHLMKVSPLSVHRWLTTGKLASIRLPGKRVIPRAALEEFLESRKTDAASEPKPRPARGGRSPAERAKAATEAAEKARALGA